MQVGPAPPWGWYCTLTCPDPDGLGYFCPLLPPAACYGRTGKQILTSIGATFKSVPADDVWLRYTVYVAIQVVAWKVAALVLLVWICSSYQRPKPQRPKPQAR